MRRRLAHRTASASGTLASRTLGKGVCSVRPLRSPETEADRTFSMTGIPFPNIDPIALEIGPLVIRWYALAYIAGILLGWRYCLPLDRKRVVSGKSVSVRLDLGGRSIFKKKTKKHNQDKK